MTKIIKIIISLCLFIFIFFKLDEFSHYNISEKDILRGNYDESVAFFDSIPVYQKNFSIENHGLELFDQKKNVISNDHTLFKIKKKRSLLKLYPEDIVIGKNPILYFETQEKLDNLFLEVEIAFETNRKEKFYLTQNYNLKKDPTLFLQKFFNFKKKKIKQLNETNYFSSFSLLKTFLKKSEEKVSYLSLKILTNNPQEIKIKRLSILNKNLLTREEDSVNLIGKINGSVPFGDYVKVIFENNKHFNAPLTTDNKFVVPNLKIGQILCVEFKMNNKFYYSNQGRWLEVMSKNQSIQINIMNKYQNQAIDKVDINKLSYKTESYPNANESIYKPHSKLIFPGIKDQIKEYEVETFTNNFGYVDRDRRIENPNNCIRIVHLGSSHAVAREVPIFQKYNIIMEHELSLLFQRCVEVFSAGTDNADIGENYLRIKKYARKFRPEIVLLENSHNLVMQLDSEMFKKGWGWDSFNSGLHGFIYNEKKQLIFKEKVSNYQLFVTKPTYENIISNVPLFKTFWVDKKLLNKKSKRALKKFSDIAYLINQEFTFSKIIFHDGLDQAQCGKKCNYKIFNNDDFIHINVENFLNILKKICNDRKLNCISLKVPKYHNESSSLTWKFDGHYSPTGHQWLAKNLSRQIYESYKNSY